MSRVALVVDDSILIRHAVRRFLEECGYSVETASNGLEGLAALDRVTPQLIVTDLMMPKLSGSEFIREVRHRAGLANVLIVVVAGRRGSVASTAKSGADYVVYKDVDLVEQLQTILASFDPSTMTPSKTAKKGQSAAS